MHLMRNDTLKEGGRGGVGTTKNRIRYALVLAEFSLALTLLAAAGLMVHSFWNITHVNMGFHTDHLLTFGLPMPTDRRPQPEQMTTFYRQMLEGVQSLPGITSASVSTGMPVQGTGFGMPFDIVGKEAAD